LTGPLRILLHLQHPGYARNYESTIRLLASRGHRVHIVWSKSGPSGDADLPLRIASETPGVTVGRAPERGRPDPWWRVAWWTRSLGDASRFLDPRYAGAVLLRKRSVRHLERKLPGVPRSLASLILPRLVRRLEGQSDAALSRRLVAFFRRLEAGIPTYPRLDEFLRLQVPDVVLVTPLVNMGGSQTDVVKSARRAGIPVGLCVASWDNLTNKGLIRGEPDAVFVWNRRQVAEAVEMHSVPEDRIVATGAQRFDFLFNRQPSRTLAEFTDVSGLPHGRPYLIYVCSSSFIAPDEAAFVRHWLAALRESDDEVLRTIPVLIRPHPQNPQDWDEIGPPDGDLAPFVVWPPAGSNPVDAASQEDFFESISYGLAVVGINTSAMIEAAILGRSTFTIITDQHALTQEGTLHFQHLLAENGGFLHIARSLAEHTTQLADGLAGKISDEERLRTFVGHFIRPRGLDRPATPILADEIERLAGVRRPRARRRLSDVLLAYSARVVFHRPSLRSGWGFRRPEPRAADAAASAVGAVSPKREANRLLYGRDPHAAIVFGPWVGTVEDELLYWIPYLRWVVDAGMVDPLSVRVHTDTGLATWYAGIGGEVRSGLPEPDARAIRFGPELLASVAMLRAIGEPPLAAMRKAVQYAPLGMPVRPVGLPDRYVVVDLTRTATFEGGLTEHVELPGAFAELDVIYLDEDGTSSDLSLPSELSPLATRDAVIAHAEGVVAGLGLTALLGVLHRVPTVALFEHADALDETVGVIGRVARALGSTFTLIRRDRDSGTVAFPQTFTLVADR
jgi:hypothetical protein